MNLSLDSWMALVKPLRSQAVEQSALSFADLGFPLRGQVSLPLRMVTQ